MHSFNKRALSPSHVIGIVPSVTINNNEKVQELSEVLGSMRA